MKLAIGDSAPLFRLFSSEKKEIALSDYQNKNVVLLFFPLAFTSVCTAELCSVRDNRDHYSNLNAEILAISVDSPFTLAKYKEDQGFNFQMLSDFNKSTSLDYGCLYDDFVLGMKSVSKRAAFIVDKKGKIQFAEVLENAGELPNFAEINKVLETLNH